MKTTDAMHAIANNGSSKVLSFRVRLGHNTLVVESETARDAIAQARRLLSLEMPRLWDVIQSTDDTRFEVDPVF